MIGNSAQEEASGTKYGKVFILDARFGKSWLNDADTKDDVFTSRGLSQDDELVQTSANKARRTTSTMLGFTLCEMSDQVGEIPRPLC